MSFWAGTLISYSILGIFSLILTVYKAFGYLRMRQSQVLDLRFVVRIFVFFCDTLGNFSLLLAFSIAVYWFFVYKYSTNVDLPVGSESGPFITILVIGMIVKLLATLHILWHQCRYDIFFIDWEKTRGELKNRSMDKPSEHAPVSFWRTIMVVNEWIRIERGRDINLELCFVLVLLLSEGTDVINLATTQPDPTDLSDGNHSRILRFLVIVFFWGCIAIFQLIIKRWIFHRWIRNPLDTFVDLCSVANISVVCLPEEYFGYYIHGQSVHSYADTGMHEFNENLKREQQDQRPLRGLLPQSTIQIFDIYVMQSFRQQFNEKLIIPIAEHEFERQIEQKQPRQNFEDAVRLYHFIFPERTPPPEKLVKAYMELNNFLQNFILKMRERSNQIIEKTQSYRMGLPPDILTFQKDLFVKDSSNNFSKVFLRGIEGHLQIFLMLCFGVLDYMMQNSFASLFVTYVIHLFVTGIRQYFGRLNLAKKTLLDSRLLL
eukprot:gb/GECH01014904.1/.p1 GENE.gb/GECH01014904.1/~~gb/GECH01014904.1/.p1  ORF type:complete len:488 (+),score=94.91 gb/GECH01014904.1/:1-1464(+)